MKIDPYTSAAGLPFGSSPDAIANFLGQPAQQTTNNIDLLEWDYGDSVVRFNAAQQVVEITLAADFVEIDNIAIPFRNLLDFIEVNDPGMFHRVGFVVSPAYGLAFDPEQAPWITAFAHGELQQWQSDMADEAG